MNPNKIPTYATMTPYELQLLLDIYIRHLRKDWVTNTNTKLFTQTILAFEDKGLLEKEKDRLTQKGEAHVRQLCNLPIPTEATAFIDKDGKIIEIMVDELVKTVKQDTNTK